MRLDIDEATREQTFHFPRQLREKGGFWPLGKKLLISIWPVKGPGQWRSHFMSRRTVSPSPLHSIVSSGMSFVNTQASILQTAYFLSSFPRQHSRLISTTHKHSYHPHLKRLIQETCSQTRQVKSNGKLERSEDLKGLKSLAYYMISSHSDGKR